MTAATILDAMDDVGSPDEVHLGVSFDLSDWHTLAFSRGELESGKSMEDLVLKGLVESLQRKAADGDLGDFFNQVQVVELRNARDEVLGAFDTDGLFSLNESVEREALDAGGHSRPSGG